MDAGERLRDTAGTVRGLCVGCILALGIAIGEAPGSNDGVTPGSNDGVTPGSNDGVTLGEAVGDAVGLSMLHITASMTQECSGVPHRK